MMKMMTTGTLGPKAAAGMMTGSHGKIGAVLTAVAAVVRPLAAGSGRGCREPHLRHGCTFTFDVQLT